MTQVLATFPGKFGDILWALPAIRSASEALGVPISLQIAGAYRSILSLLQAQPYLGRVVADDTWVVQDTAPMTPRVPPHVHQEETAWDHVFHLGYRGWPSEPLPYETFQCLRAQWPAGVIGAAPVDLARPWMEWKPYVFM